MLAISRTELYTIKRALSDLANGEDAQELLADSCEIIDSILEKNIEIIVPDTAVRQEPSDDEIEVEGFPWDEDLTDHLHGDLGESNE